MSLFDFRSAHLTVSTAAVAVLCTVLGDMVGLSFASNAASGSSGTLPAARTGNGGLIRSLNNLFSGGFVGPAVRAFSLPLAWTSLLSLFCLVSYSRTLERRFGSPRFAVISLFVGGTAAALHRALLAVAAPVVGGSAGAPSFVYVNSSVWNAVIISLATLVSLRVPPDRFQLGRNRHNSASPGRSASRASSTAAGAPADHSDVRRYFPVVFATISAGLTCHAGWSLLQGNGGGTSVRFAQHSAGSTATASSPLMRNIAAALCALAAGAAPSAAVHFHRPLMSSLFSIADANPLRSLVNRILYGSSSSPVHVRQHGAERQRAAALRHAVEDNDDHLNAAIRASLADRGGAGAQQQQPGGGGAGGGHDEVRVLAGGDHHRGGGRRGVNPNNMMFHQQQGAGGAAPQQAHAQQPPPAAAGAGAPTPAEQQSVNFLREIAPHASEAQMLAVLRTCRGDANAAASLLLEGAAH